MLTALLTAAGVAFQASLSGVQSLTGYPWTPRTPVQEISSDSDASDDDMSWLPSREDMHVDTHVRRRLTYNGYRTRNYRATAHYWESPWGRLLLGSGSNANGVEDDDSSTGRLFRRRFRVPWSIYCKIVQMCKDKDIFGVRARDRCDQETIPVELRVLGVLRILGRGAVFDDIAELSGMSESSALRSFKMFCMNFSRTYYHEYVQVPSGERLKSVLTVYARLGLPGCIGSTDCVHVKLDKCPVSLKHAFPTLSFSVTVDLSRRILASTGSQLGARNDKTICRFDTFLTGVRDGKLPTTPIEYKLYKADGTFDLCRQAWLLCDGGYHKWITMICPIGLTCDRQERLWSEWVESVRKDVECTFGIIKARFRYFKNGVRCRMYYDIDASWFTACILHNMLLDYDGRSDAWDDAKYWEALDTDAQEEIPELEGNGHLRVPELAAGSGVRLHQRRVIVRANLPSHGHGLARNEHGNNHVLLEGNDTVEEVAVGYHAFRRCLIAHFKDRWKANAIQWPRRLVRAQITGHPMITIQRSEED
jgi:hypothetical protein